MPADFKKIMVSQFSGHGRNYSTSSGGLSHKIASDEVHPILDSTNFPHWFKDWQNLRTHKLTASTFSAAIGFFAHRRKQLWLEKIGAREPFHGNWSTYWSNIMEEEALKRYKRITGNNDYISFPDFQIYGKTNNEDGWLAASPDGIVNKLAYKLPSGGVLEIKCPYFGGDMSQAWPLKRMPVSYIPQAQGLMEILDTDWMDLYVWTTKGSTLFRLHRDVEYWKLIKTALSDFWWKHVQPAKELYADSVISNHLDELESFRPAARHESFPRIIHQSKKIVDNSKLLMREINYKWFRD